MKKRIACNGVVYFPASVSPRGVGTNKFPILVGFEPVNSRCWGGYDQAHTPD